MAEGHRKRLRLRVGNQGITGLYPHEILEFVLQPLVPRKETNDLAHRLLKKYGSLYGVLSAEAEDLRSVEGVTPMVADFLPRYVDIVRYAESAYRRQETSFQNLGTVHAYLKSFLKGEGKERLLLMTLDQKKKLIAKNDVSTGDLTEVSARKRDIIEVALRDNAKYAVLCHNHPFGSARPSASDIEETFRLEDLLQEVGVTLYDHVIYGSAHLFSFRAAAILGWDAARRAEIRKLGAEQLWQKYVDRQKHTEQFSEEEE